MKAIIGMMGTHNIHRPHCDGLALSLRFSLSPYLDLPQHLSETRDCHICYPISRNVIPQEHHLCIRPVRNTPLNRIYSQEASRALWQR